ncbi:serpin I2 isoform X2 [Canis lupus baileyi]|uniref:serpin I2 isoform X2 n=1 Tax=Canis lupus dingo TaxID=286419 RepID=UPI0015F1515F|nr:serpin I2 isoform X2 [Canis lupus dingo]XP_038318889.1 serpin I2 isoform X2 [Canis lupus familiaris]XP_038439735.1 serpin I2 isoform X2 [Canis lupus familiaris]
MNKILLWSLLLIFSGSQASRPLVQRNVEFAVDLYQTICLSHENNIIFSPLGTTLVLGMIQLGAKGRAQQQIRQTLKLQENSTGKIKDMFSGEDFGPLTRLVLVNAIYFKGDWKQKFRKEDTQLTNFTKKDGAAVKIPMMKALLRTKYGYFSEPSMNYQVLELPYKGDGFSLIIILPAEDVNIEEMEKRITAHQILKWFSEMQEEEVEVSLPRFKVEQKLDFKEALYSLNMTEIFSGGCDLSGITDSAEVFVSQVMQHIFFEINEDGSEAATATGMHIPAIMSLAHNQFIANHPFLFIVKNNPTESILFMGRVTNPDTQKMKGRDLDSL